jgi:hypothetical protein
LIQLRILVLSAGEKGPFIETMNSSERLKLTFSTAEELQSN